MNIKSYVKKFITLFYIKINYGNNFVPPNLYLLNIDKDALLKAKKILFYFPDEEYMHLGDHLFFLPLIKSFIDSGYDVTVLPTAPMRSFFQELHIKLPDDKYQFGNFDVVISRVELAQSIHDTRLILVNVSKGLSEPICSELITQFSKLFYLVNPCCSIDFSSFKNDEATKLRFGLINDKSIIFFNTYCDSSSFLITEEKKQLLFDLVTELAQSSLYRIVLVGSQKDKENDKSVYNFEYIDLRGKTTVVDLFNLVSLSNVKYYLGFDAFVMHVFSLLHKNSFVVFRGRVFKWQDTMLRKFHVNLFKGSNFVTLFNRDNLPVIVERLKSN